MPTAGFSPSMMDQSKMIELVWHFTSITMLKKVPGILFNAIEYQNIAQ
jgi:hypothetical protein